MLPQGPKWQDLEMPSCRPPRSIHGCKFTKTSRLWSASIHGVKIKNDYNSSPQPCAELDYLDIQPPTGELRYNQDNTTSSLSIDASEASPILGLYHPNSSLAPGSSYTHDSSGFYPTGGSIFTPDGRLRLNSNTASTGMAHVQLQNHRTPTLPHLGQHINTRDQFTASVAAFRRVPDQFVRSPSFSGSRRQQLSASQNPLTGYTPQATRMESHQYTHRPGPAEVPPLMAIEMLGTLQYMDQSMTNVKVDISGIIDKGPFLSGDREWTCYRRNYLACICSFSLSPNYPGLGIQFTPSSGAGASQPWQVYGFAMCISAMVADNEQHNIELVQHTPKRDKGPVSKPGKTVLAPKTSSTPHSSSLNMYADDSSLGNPRSLYTDGFGGQSGVGGQQVPTEHTFERIQFKQATQNNGKRRAAQQYYHLVVELWADVGSQAADQFVKVASRKSVKMIVRGRSPGHYQNERRNSQGNGTSGAAGGAGYRAMAQMGDFGNGPGMTANGLGGYSSGYDTRGTSYNHVRQQEMSPDSIFSSGDDKPSGKAGYQYYTGSSTYDAQQHDRVDMFSTSHRNGVDTLHSSLTNDRKVKPEFDFNMLPSPFAGGARTDDHHRERFDGRPSSGGFYPSIVSSTGLGTL